MATYRNLLAWQPLPQFEDGDSIEDSFMPAKQPHTLTDFGGKKVTLIRCGVKNRDFTDNVILIDCFENGKHVAPDIERSQEEIQKELDGAGIEELALKLKEHAYKNTEIVGKKIKEIYSIPEMEGALNEGNPDKKVKIVDELGEWK